MTCCLCSIWGSKSWILLIVPMFAVFASFSSSHDAFFTSITLSSLLVLLSTFVFFKLSKQNSITMQENPEALSSAAEKSEFLKEKLVKGNKEEFFIQQQDFYSESESLDQFSTTSSEEDHSSDAELKQDFSDGSISDEESLIEIEIPSGEFLSPKKDSHFNFKCCKLSADFSVQSLDFFTDMNNEMNEEDNLIEIDIYMGSIKYPAMGFS